MADSEQSRPLRVRSIDHVELFVPDLDLAADWYSRAFGLKPDPASRRWALEGGPLMMATAEAGTKLALFAGAPVKAPHRAGFRRVAFRVNGEEFLRYWAEHARIPVYDREGKALRALEPVDHNLSFSLYFCDPYGHPFEITTYDYDRVKAQLERGPGSEPGRA